MIRQNDHACSKDETGGFFPSEDSENGSPKKAGYYPGLRFRLIQLRRVEAKRVDEELQQNLERARAFHEMGMTITSTLDPDAILQMLLDKIEMTLPNSATTVRLINRDTGELELIASRNVDEQGLDGGRKNLHGLSEIVLRSKSPLAIANVQTDPRILHHDFVRRNGLVSYLGVPLMVKGDAIGLVAFYTKEGHTFTDDEVTFLTALASQSAMAIHNARLYDETKRSEGEISALHALTLAATQSLDLDLVLKEAIKKITEIFRFDATRVYLFNTAMDELSAKAAFEATPEFWTQVRVFRRGQGIVGKVVETGESFISEDIRRDPRYLEISHSKSSQKAGTRLFAVFPIKTKRRAWGAMVCVGENPRKLTGDEIRLLTSMTNQMGIAVENATLYEQTVTKAKELSALYSVARIASESLDLDTLLGTTMHNVLEIFGFEAARIYLRNIDATELHLAVHEGIPSHVPLLRKYKVGEGRMGRVIETGEPSLVADMHTDPTYHASPNKFMLKAGFRSSFLIPIRVRGDCLGVMNFLSKNPYRFSESDLELINAVAYHVGIAVGNANLFSQVKQKAIELENAIKGKDEFLGVMSHELRTPLNVIKGYTELMMEHGLGEINPGQTKALETVRKQVLDLSNMISSVLQVTTIEAGAVHIEISDVNLCALLDELRRSYSVPFSRELTVVWNYPADLPVLRTDQEKLKAILQNLINNAVKFTERGQVVVSVRYVSESDRLEFKIADTGIGIPKEKVESIFERFEQVDSSATRPYGGVGLGLYIVKKFVELIGGAVAVESEPGQGSTFAVVVPASTASQTLGHKKFQPSYNAESKT